MAYLLRFTDCRTFLSVSDNFSKNEELKSRRGGVCVCETVLALMVSESS